MRAAMAAAEVGDEQAREDPTVNELQRRAAELLGHEAALFLPTATMANQIALRVLTTPGSLLVAEERTHVLVYEAGGPAIHSGLVMTGLPGTAGRILPEQLRALSGLGPGGAVVLEQTHRSSGGRVWPLGDFQAVVQSARELGAAVHLDGARLFNAAVASGIPATTFGALADMVTVCFSKGLGCPLGAILAGPAERIEEAWEGKFLFGGAMRQAGIVAAAALYALEHNIDRLAEDHARARRLAAGLADAGVPVDPETVETNFVGVEVVDVDEGRAALRAEGVLAGVLRPGVLRLATYPGLTDEDVDVAIAAIPRALRAAAVSVS
jgi:threonine aldolase